MTIIRHNRYVNNGGFYRNSIHGGVLNMHDPLSGGGLFSTVKNAGSKLITKVAGKELLKKAKAKAAGVLKTAVVNAPKQIQKLKRKAVNKMMEGAPPLKKINCTSRQCCA